MCPITGILALTRLSIILKFFPLHSTLTASQFVSFIISLEFLLASLTFLYVLNGKSYIYRGPKVRGPNPVLQIIGDLESGDSQDVTKEILQYLGPAYDWHNQTVSPSDLGYIGLHFMLSSGDCMSYYDSTICTKIKN